LLDLIVTTLLTNCRIVCVGKRRDGGSRYWCLEHKADATAKYGRRGKKCRYALVPQILPSEILDLHLDDYAGGVALWGAVPPIYDTTSLKVERGVHVHARRVAEADKYIDQTYRAVRLFKDGQEVGIVSELDAIYFMVASVFDYKMKYVVCELCGFPHLDKDWFSLHPHRRHLCAGCGKQFRDTEKAIGNPAIRINETLHSNHRVRTAPITRTIKQEDFPGGVQIWGSNSAILWTSSEPEHSGVHIHAFGKDKTKPEIDETYSSLTVDGVKLDARIVRTFMAQRALPHIEGRVVDLQCPSCRHHHFATGEDAFTPKAKHLCRNCGAEFPAKGRLRNVIGNPMVGLITRLTKHAVRTPQVHASNLIPETL
jgi:transposase-like protein